MVSQGIRSNPVSNAENSGKHSVADRNKKVNDDFTKILSNQSDGKSSVKNNDLKEMKDNPPESDKIKEIIQKAFSGEKKEVKETPQDMELVTTGLLEVVPQVMNDIINIISENLNVSCEDVEEAMVNLGISIEDLINPEKTNELICEITGIESTMDILTNTELSRAVKNIYSQVDQVISEVKTEFNLSDEELSVFFTEIVSDDVNELKPEIDSAKKDDVFQEMDEISDNLSKDGEVHVSLETDGEETNNNAGYEENDEMSENTPGNPVVKEVKNHNAVDNEKIVLQENGFNNLVDEIKENISGQLEIEDESVSDRIIRQITDDIKFRVTSETKSLEIQLEPESLGKVSLMVVSKAGSLTAQLTVQNEVAKEAVESHIAQLKESFDNQGLKVEAVEVTIASKEFEENLDKENNSSDQQNKKGRRRISEDELAEINGIIIDREESEEMIRDMGNNTVSYKA